MNKQFSVNQALDRVSESDDKRYGILLFQNPTTSDTEFSWNTVRSSLVITNRTASILRTLTTGMRSISYSPAPAILSSKTSNNHFHRVTPFSFRHLLCIGSRISLMTSRPG